MARAFTDSRLIVASHNQGKVREIAHLLAPFGLETLSVADLGLPEPEETGSRFVDNALIKAQAAAEGGRTPALADDSGLCVAALDGAPGVYTADWAEQRPVEGSPGRDWYMAMGKVEGKLAALGPDADRRAWFVCTLALAWPDGHAETFEGRVEGRLTWPPRGTKGFGYDPVFVPDGHNQTFGEMAPEDKHAMSHRADAFAKLIHACFRR